MRTRELAAISIKTCEILFNYSIIQLLWRILFSAKTVKETSCTAVSNGPRTEIKFRLSPRDTRSVISISSLNLLSNCDNAFVYSFLAHIPFVFQPIQVNLFGGYCTFEHSKMMAKLKSSCVELISKLNCLGFLREVCLLTLARAEWNSGQQELSWISSYNAQAWCHGLIFGSHIMNGFICNKQQFKCSVIQVTTAVPWEVALSMTEFQEGVD